jgi:hypothetical protein
LDYTKVIILILWWRNFQLEYWRTFQLVSTLEGMRGTGVFFITPKENFKHLRSKDPQSAKVWMQGENYDVKIFAEWWEATGFWLAEAIFAYLPPAEEASVSSASDDGI